LLDASRAQQIDHGYAPRNRCSCPDFGAAGYAHEAQRNGSPCGKARQRPPNRLNGRENRYFLLELGVAFFGVAAGFVYLLGGFDPATTALGALKGRLGRPSILASAISDAGPLPDLRARRVKGSSRLALRHIPVDQAFLRSEGATHLGVVDIGTADRQTGADNDPEKQAHLWFSPTVAASVSPENAAGRDGREGCIRPSGPDVHYPRDILYRL
jgi:hypothetical protein